MVSRTSHLLPLRPQFHSHRFLVSSVVKQRMQVHGSTFPSVASCFRAVYRAEGLSAFYVSYPTTLTMTVPFTAVQFSTYEFFK